MKIYHVPEVAERIKILASDFEIDGYSDDMLMVEVQDKKVLRFLRMRYPHMLEALEGKDSVCVLYIPNEIGDSVASQGHITVPTPMIKIDFHYKNDLADVAKNLEREAWRTVNFMRSVRTWFSSTHEPAKSVSKKHKKK